MYLPAVGVEVDKVLRGPRVHIRTRNETVRSGSIETGVVLVVKSASQKRSAS